MPGHILILEGDPRTSDAICALMHRAGLPVHATKSVARAVVDLTRLPSLVLLDFTHSDGSEIQVLEMVRHVGMRTKVGVVLAATDRALYERLRELRPDALFGKPFNFEDFAVWLCEVFPAATPYVAAA